MLHRRQLNVYASHWCPLSLFVVFTIEEIILENCLLISLRGVLLVGITLLYPSYALSIPFKSEEE